MTKLDFCFKRRKSNFVFVYGLRTSNFRCKCAMVGSFFEFSYPKRVYNICSNEAEISRTQERGKSVQSMMISRYPGRAEYIEELQEASQSAVWRAVLSPAAQIRAIPLTSCTLRHGFLLLAQLIVCHFAQRLTFPAIQLAKRLSSSPIVVPNHLSPASLSKLQLRLHLTRS